MTNVFGSTNFKSITNYNAIKKEFDAQFIRLTKRFDTTLNKNEDLDMNNHKIYNVPSPQELNDVVTKEYCDNKISQENLGNSLQFPINNLDIVNKFYLQLYYYSDDLNATDLLKIADVIKDTLESCPDKSPVTKKYEDIFLKSYNISQNLYMKYLGKFREDRAEKCAQELKNYFSIYSELRIHIIHLILNMPTAVFQNLKARLLSQQIGLDVTPNEKSINKKLRRFINQTSRDIDPNRMNENLDLIIQKSLLILLLGFNYVDGNLLSQLFSDD